jgi:hypothetical protein
VGLQEQLESGPIPEKMRRARTRYLSRQAFDAIPAVYFEANVPDTGA